MSFAMQEALESSAIFNLTWMKVTVQIAYILNSELHFYHNSKGIILQSYFNFIFNSKYIIIIILLVGLSGRAVWSIGLDRLDAEIVG
jgi:hypothetical protein